MGTPDLLLIWSRSLCKRRRVIVKRALVFYITRGVNVKRRDVFVKTGSVKVIFRDVIVIWSSVIVKTRHVFVISSFVTLKTRSVTAKKTENEGKRDRTHAKAAPLPPAKPKLWQECCKFPPNKHLANSVTRKSRCGCPARRRVSVKTFVGLETTNYITTQLPFGR